MRLFAVVSLLAVPVACEKAPPATKQPMVSAPTSVTAPADPGATLSTNGSGFDDVDLPRVPAAVTGAAGVGAPSPMASESSPNPLGANQPVNSAPASDRSLTIPSASADSPAANPQSPSFPIPTIGADLLSLPNGLRLILIPDQSVSQVSVTVAYDVGSRDEEINKYGINKLVEFLMFQGSQHAPGPIIPRLEKAGVNVSANGADSWVQEDRSVFFTSAPANVLEQLLWLESDRMGFLTETLDAKQLEQARDAVINDHRRQLERPTAVFFDLISRYFYPAGHPYSHTPHGRTIDLQAISVEDVKAWHKRWFAPNNATLTIAGKFAPETAKELVAKYFGNLPSAAVRSRATVPAPALAQNILIDRQEPLAQPKLTLSWHTPAAFSPDEPALTLATHILANSRLARLNRLLVFEKQLATRVQAIQLSRELSGLFVIEVLALDERKLPEIEQLIEGSLQALAQEGPSSSELDAGKASVEFKMVSAIERIGGPGGKADRLSQYVTHYGDPRKFDTDIARHMTVTSRDVAAVVNRWLAGKPRLTVRYYRGQEQPLAGSGVDRTLEPKIDGQMSVDLPGFTSKTLENGLTLHVVNRPGLPKVEVAVIIKRGDLAESDANAGTSYLTAAALIRATKTRSNADIEAQLALLGAELTTEGSKFGSAVTLSVLKRNLDAASELLADVVRNPSFPPADVAALRDIRRNQIKEEQANAAILANEMIPRVLFAGGNPTGIPDRGLEGSLAKLEATDLIRHHEQFWLPNNAALLVVGDVTLDDAEKLANKHFGSWTRGADLDSNITLGTSPGVPYVFLVDAPGAKEVEVRVAGVAERRTSTAQTAVQIINHILGGSYESRIVHELRQAKLAARNVYSQIIQNPYGGYWMAAATVLPADVVRTAEAIRNAINGMTGSTPEIKTQLESDVASAKRILTQRFVAKFETQEQILRETAPMIVEGRDGGANAQALNTLLSETPQSIETAWRKHYDLNRAIVLMIGDLKQIEAPVAALHWGETLVLSPEIRVLRKAETPATPNAEPPLSTNTTDLAPGLVPPGPIHPNMPNVAPGDTIDPKPNPASNNAIPAAVPPGTQPPY